MIEDEKISLNDTQLRELQNYLYINNDMTKVLCSLCQLKNIDRYIDVLNNLICLNEFDKRKVEKLISLRQELNKIPSYKVFLRAISEDCILEETSNLYTQDELDEIFELFQNKNIKYKIYQCVREFIKCLNKGIFDDSILNEMCDYNLELHKVQEIDDCYDRLKEIYDNHIDREPISTGIDELDRNDISIAKKEVSVIMGGTGSFKTTFVSNIAYNKAKAGMNVAYVSLEVPKEDMYFNFLSLHSTDKKFEQNIPQTELKSSKLLPEQEKCLFEKVYDDFKTIKQHITIIDEKDIGLNTFSSYTKLLTRIDRDFQRKTNKGIDILVIDHLQMLKHNTDLVNDNPYIIVAKWVEYFRKNTVNFLDTGKSIATILVSQVNRKGYEESLRNYGKYKFTALADSVEIERSASNIFAISASTMKYTSEIVITPLKYRNKPDNHNSIHIEISPEYYSFNRVIQKTLDIELSQGIIPNLYSNDNESSQQVDDSLLFDMFRHEEKRFKESESLQISFDTPLL